MPEVEIIKLQKSKSFTVYNKDSITLTFYNFNEDSEVVITTYGETLIRCEIKIKEYCVVSGWGDRYELEQH